MKKKFLSLALVLALCLGLTVPAFAAGTVKVVEDKTQGLKITLNGFLREETHSYIHDYYYDRAAGEMREMVPVEHTIYVVADNSTVTIEALAGRKYADASSLGLDWGGVVNVDSSARETWGRVFLDNRESYAYIFEDDGGVADVWVWNIEDKCFGSDYAYTWPLEEAVTETVSPTDDTMYLCLSTGYGIDWLCESDYAKLVPVDGGQPTVSTVGGFIDVKTGDYFADPVLWAVEKGITAGTSKTTFSPNENCSVAQILTFLWRANGSPKPTGSNPFTDVKSGDYYADAAAWAYEKGMVSGSTFGGNAPCTRSMAVTYMWKAAGSPAASYDGKFGDVPANADYAQAVAWAVEQGVTAGTSSTTFSPDNVCTRGQIATFLYRGLAK